MVLTLVSDTDLFKLTILSGAFIGNFIATMIPFWIAKQKYGEFDIKIIFNPKFLGTALGAAISSFVIVNSAFGIIMQQVGSQSTVAAAFISAMSIGAALNYAGNKLLPSPTNPKESAQLEDAKKQQIIEEYENQKIIDAHKASLSNNQSSPAA